MQREGFRMSQKIRKIYFHFFLIHQFGLLFLLRQQLIFFYDKIYGEKCFSQLKNFYLKFFGTT